MKISLLVLPIGIIFLAGILYFFSLIIKALKKYINSNKIREEKVMIKKSIGELIKQHRTSCKMTQEFVAESIGVSRQAVSKWENGVADPSTSNLIALSKLFSISPEDLIKELQDN